MKTNILVCKEVNKVVNKFKTRDPFEICKNLNINIYYKDLGLSVKAYYFCQSRIKNIIINNNVDDIISNILCAHELGHALLHSKISTTHTFHEVELLNLTTKTEFEANLFAAELLIPDETLLELIKEKKSFFSIASELYVPYQLLDFKLGILNAKGFPITKQNISSSTFLKYL